MYINIMCMCVCCECSSNKEKDSLNLRGSKGGMVGTGERKGKCYHFILISKKKMYLLGNPPLTITLKHTIYLSNEPGPRKKTLHLCFNIRRQHG